VDEESWTGISKMLLEGEQKVVWGWLFVSRVRLTGRIGRPKKKSDPNVQKQRSVEKIHELMSRYAGDKGGHRGRVGYERPRKDNCINFGGKKQVRKTNAGG